MPQLLQCVTGVAIRHTYMNHDINLPVLCPQLWHELAYRSVRDTDGSLVGKDTDLGCGPVARRQGSRQRFGDEVGWVNGI